jgi:YD repeat-containing protein
VVSITTDDFGNELSRTEASGVRTEYTYYPVTGEPRRCPADPHGLFQRYLKLEKLFPARSTTAARTTEHSHTDVSITGGGYFVMPLAINLEGGTHTSYTYHSVAANTALHGRLKSSTTTIDKLSLVSDFTCTFNGDSITEVRSLKGREPGQWLESARTWSLTNQRLLDMTRDAVGSLAMTYDVSGRLTSETAAPGTLQMARRRYAYHFSAGAKMAHLVTTDAQGTVLFTYFDGMGRQLSAAQSLDGIADNDRLLGSWAYDALGAAREANPSGLSG